MKSALIFATTLATTFAHGPEADRRLGNWNEDSGLSAGTTGGSSECHFRATGDLFAKTWTVQSQSEGLDGTTLDGFSMTEGGAYHSNKRVTGTNWQNTSHPILIARFEVDLTLTNYKAAVKDAATKNYKYYDYSNGWQTTKLNDQGTEKMTSICVYKSGHPVPGVCTGDIQVAITDGGSNGQPGTIVTVDLGVRKTLGIATTCGTADGNDLGGSLDAASENIFVWGTLSAQQSLNFLLTRNHQGSDAYNGLTTGEESGPTPVENTIDGDNYVSVTLNVVSPHPITHDLLFIEQHTENTEYLFSSHPGCEPDSTGKCKDVTEYRIDIGDPTLDESVGGISITAANNQAFTCAVTLTVQSGRPNHWHCFRDTQSLFVPSSTHDSTDFTQQHGAAALQNLVGAAVTPTATNGGCTAQLQVDCTSMQLTVTGTDSRECDFSTGFGANAPQYTGGNAATNAAAETARQTAYKQCVESAWFQDKSYFLNDVVISGAYTAAIVQAVRLTNTRRYPHDASSSSKNIIVGNSFVVPSGTTASTNWECTDGQTCANEDPYRVLKTETVTAESKFATALTFVTDDMDDSNGGALNWKASAVQDSGNGGSGVTADHSITTTCRRNGAALTCTAGPDYDSTPVALVNPPAGFPESYVFGIVSFDFTGNNGDGADYDLFVRPNGIEDEVPDSAGDTKHSRRLLRSSAPRGVQKSILVNAVQNVINK